MTRAVRAQQGSVAIEFALGLGVLLLPVCLLVLTLPTWTERQSMAQLAAQEAARTMALADDTAAGVAAGRAAAEQVAANHEMADALQAVDLQGQVVRGGTVEATVRVAIPLPSIPFLTAGRNWSWLVSHREAVDAYRSFL